MRIGLDGRPFAAPHTGIWRYVTELCCAVDRLLPDTEFFVYSPTPVPLPPSLNRERWIPRVDVKCPPRLARRSFIWLKTRGAHLAKSDSLDAYWGSATFLPPGLAGPRLISTVYDLVSIVAPQTMRRQTRWQHHLFFERDLRRADQRVAVSDGTAQRLKRHMGLESRVVRPGVSAAFRRMELECTEAVLSKHGIRQPFLLFVGTWEPRKNLEGLLDAFVQLKASGSIPTFTLVLAGAPGWSYGRLASKLRTLGRHVKVLGYVPDSDLPALYTACDVFVFPSLYEGYGLPVAEARACGARVVTSDEPELREAGGNGPIYVSPTADGIKNGILAGLAGPPSPATTSSRQSMNEIGAEFASVLRGDYALPH